MRFQTRKNHVIDLLFPIAIFFVFAVSALTVILLAANIYQSTTARASENYNARTALSYISEKVHQNDIDGGISAGIFDGCDSLILEQTFDDSNYFTYIYEDDGYLKELFVKEGIDASASSGKAIIPVSDFTVDDTGDGLFHFSVTDENNQTASVVVRERSSL